MTITRSRTIWGEEHVNVIFIRYAVIITNASKIPAGI
jgi:hypothetical protein